MFKFSQRVEETNCKTNLIVKHKNRKIFQQDVLCIKIMKHLLPSMIYTMLKEVALMCYIFGGVIIPFVGKTYG